MKNTITYFFDPICGWCYGFSAHFNQFFNEHSEAYDLKMVTGGMVRAHQARPIGERAEYLKEAYPRVTELSGAQFGERFVQRLEEGSAVYSSDMPSKIFHAISSVCPEQSHEIARQIQLLIYQQGIDPEDASAYAPLESQFDLEVNRLSTLVEQTEIVERYNMDLYTTQQFDVRGFPFVIVQLDDELYLLSRGFATSEQLKDTLARAKRYHAERSLQPKS